jgi:heme A synthase
MNKPLHHRAFAVTVAWTLALLTLGSVVHATESSLACPDWPTCFGTMLPEMSGGVFWEHLHRLVAGGLILMFGLATVYAWREPGSPRWIRGACVAGLALLLVQALFGGLTVLLRLPDAVSTTHLGLALLFLALAVVLAGATSPRRARRPGPGAGSARVLRVGATVAGALVLAQSLLGGLVRHADAGMACPDLPGCLGAWVPPLSNDLVALHFAHRVVGVLTALLVLGLAARLVRASDAPAHVRRWAGGAALLVLVQVGLGALSVTSLLAVAPVSLHTLGAASLLAVLTLLATWGFQAGPAAGRVNHAAAGAPSAARR